MIFLQSTYQVHRGKPVMSFLAWVLALLPMLYGCNPDTELTYNSSDNVYFGLSTEVGLSAAEITALKLDTRDTVVSYTFALTPEKSTDTVWLPVALSGKRVPRDRSFKVTVEATGSTAEVSRHYQPLKDSYMLPADSGYALLPIVLFNTDVRLDTQSFNIKLRLVNSNDLRASVGELSTQTIMFSNRLEKPEWWNRWEGELGAYSRTKHALYLITVGNIDLVPNFDGDNQYMIPENLYYIEKLKALVAYPFDWVANNDKGYVLTEQPDGSYFLHHQTNADKKYLLKKSDEDGKYYFIDEAGLPVTINH